VYQPHVRPKHLQEGRVVGEEVLEGGGEVDFIGKDTENFGFEGEVVGKGGEDLVHYVFYDDHMTFGVEVTKDDLSNGFTIFEIK